MDLAAPRVGAGDDDGSPLPGSQIDETDSPEQTGRLRPLTIRELFRGDRKGGVFARLFDYLVRLNGSPEAIAWGLALGLFVAMTPTVGFQTLIVIPLAMALRVNKASAAVGVWLTNPLTIPFLYGLAYWVGSRLLGRNGERRFDSDLTWASLLDASPHVVFSLLLGGVVLGAVAALVSYLPALYTIRAGRAAALLAARRRRQRRAARARARAYRAEPGR